MKAQLVTNQLVYYLLFFLAQFFYCIQSIYRFQIQKSKFFYNLYINNYFRLKILFVYYRNEKQYIKLPKNIADAKQLGNVLKKYNQDHFYAVFAAVFLIYVL